MNSPSIWELETFYAPRDIIILGSGLAGLWSAWYLKKANPKLNMLILDKGMIPTGASTRNAGFACYGSLTELMEDARMMGEDNMLELLSMRIEGLSRIRKVLNKKEIGYIRNGGYELITEKEYADKRKLREDIKWLNHALAKHLKKKRAFRIADDKISRFGFQHIQHLVENKTEAQLHSGMMVNRLLKMVQQVGVQVMNQVEVKKMTREGGQVLLETNLPVTLQTNQLLICTNAFTPELIRGIDIVPARGQVLVTSPLKKLPFRGTFHYDEGYYYFRDLGDRVLLGGARNKAFKEEETTAFTISVTIQQELERFLKEVVLPGQSFTIEHRWSGIMGMGKQKLPIIKMLEPGIFCATGLGGMGVTLSPILGERVAKMMKS